MPDFSGLVPALVIGGIVIGFIIALVVWQILK